MKNTIQPLAAFILIGLQAALGDIEVQNTNDSGAGSLRQAISDAASGETITFNGALAGQTILSMSGQYLIDKNINIDASAIGGITIDGNGLVTSNRIFEISAGATNIFDSLTLTNGQVLESPFPADSGGAIFVNNGAHLTLNQATLSGNTARLHGGAIYVNAGANLTLNSATLSRNRANNGDGGSIRSDSGTITLNNSTLFGNTANNFGGGIASAYGTLTLNHATLSANTAAAGGGIATFYGTLNSTNSIMAGNVAGFDFDNIYNEETIAAMVNSLTAGDPLLVELGDYGGPTQTMPPLPGSPAIDAGGTTDLLTDQRGFVRVVGSAPDIGAVEFNATIVFNDDDSGLGSLRQAIIEAASGDTITFAAALDGATILLTSGQMLINKNLDIDASALVNGITIDGNASVTEDRIFKIEAGATNVFDSLTLTNGTAFTGGAIYVNDGADLTLNNCTLSGNRALLRGGGIYGGTLNNCTLSGNTATDHGGGSYYGTLNNCTLSGNTANEYGGGSYYSTLNHCTLSGNTAAIGGGSYHGTLNHCTLSGNRAGSGGGCNGGTLNHCILSGNRAGYGGGSYSGTLSHCTLSGNTAAFGGGNYYGTLNNCIIYFNTASSSGDNNKEGTFSYSCTTPLPAGDGNISSDPQFVNPAAGDFHLLGSSPCRDGGDNATVVGSSDRDGKPRILNGTVDMGAYEYGAGIDLGSSPIHYVSTNSPTPTWPYSSWGTAAHVLQEAVDTAASGDSVIVSNGIYETGGAITPGYAAMNRVVITNAISVQSVNGPETTFIVGAGPAGSNAVRGVYMSTGTLSGFTITNGHTRTSGHTDYDKSGAGVNLYAGNGVVSNCTLSGNTAYSRGGGSIEGTLSHCTLSGNTAATGGGSHESTLNHCTLSDNTANFGGGSFQGMLNNCTLSGNTGYSGGGCNGGTLNHCTLSGNTATHLGGGSYYGTLNHCTLSGNTATHLGGGNYYGTLNNCIVYWNTAPTGSNDYNGIFSYSCTTPLPAGTGNISADPLLAPLGDYGGPTQTMPPLLGSPAIDAGGTTSRLTDQRGYPRVINDIADIGAAEFNLLFDSAPLTNLSPAHMASGTPLNPTFSWTSNGADSYAFFMDGVLQGTTNGSTFMVTSNLAGNTTYTWRVDSLFGSVNVPGTNQSITTRASLIVDTTADPGTLGDGFSSLRQVVTDAQAGETISFAGVLDDATILLTSGQILIDKNLDIDASALLNGITIDGNGLVYSNRIFEIATNITNVFSSLTLTNGWVSKTPFPADSGGAIFVHDGAHLTLNQTTLSGNTASRYGGAICVNSDANLMLNNATLSGNTAKYGGGIESAGTITINNSTLFGNTAQYDGGGIYIGIYTVTLNHATLSGNTAIIRGGGIGAYGAGTINCTNSIIAGNSASISAYNNLETGSNTFIVNSITNAPPLLAPLGDYGGPTQTMLPLLGSPAIDAGGTTALLTDQRGFARVINNIADIGAAEFNPQLDIDPLANLSPAHMASGTPLNPTFSWTSNGADAYAFFMDGVLQGTTNGSAFMMSSNLPVNTTYTWRVDSLFGSVNVPGTNQSMTTRASLIVDTTADPGTLGDGFSSLRQAITDALAGETISFSGALDGATIRLNRGQILIDKNLDIDAAALANGITIDGNGGVTSNRIFEISTGARNVFDSLTLTHGLATGSPPNSYGGAIYANEGADLTLNNSTLSGNKATYGGGIYGGTLNNCTLSGNTANSYGGGSYAGMLNNCTLFGNTATYGGGVYGGTLNHCTLSGNTATHAGGGNQGGTLNHCIVYLNTAAISGDNNVEGTFAYSCTTPLPTGTGNISDDPQLAPLGDYGGPTQTMPPLPGSPAIDAGGTTALLTDQRGFARVIGSAADIGAVEYQGVSDLSFDADGDGNPFGVEYALGTDWLMADRTNNANLAALSTGGAAFGFNPAASNNTAWVLKRSLNLASDPFTEIYRYDGPTDTTTTNSPVSVNWTATGIEVHDLSGATNAYYQFEAEVSP